ncbi:hypothetical protein HFP89_07995 [Wenzhouxiangella sp. XN79A]|uniref:hypothetical protein n=1 Tax=Wenzhouxiangella sp. XN79A TaxID=2724193 RepID=UPI00144AF659|nr:hypothetical protein [Wenzhouxiangella sp. XN79A]NKI35105.1 hypothetical protein [Wenzhouxiangella sp. XN79A]
MIDHQEQPLEVLEQVIPIARLRLRAWWVCGSVSTVTLVGALTWSTEPKLVLLGALAAWVTAKGAEQTALHAEIISDCKEEIERRGHPENT